MRDGLELAVEHVAAVRAGDAPADGDLAVECVKHHLSCALAGIPLAWSLAAREAALAVAPEPASYGSGGCTGIGVRRPLPVGEAMFVNAVLGQSTLAEDVHPDSLVHAGSIVVSTALAVAEWQGSSGADLVRAIIAGYDVACWFGTVLKTPAFIARGVRPSAAFGVFGSAAATAVLLGLTVDQTRSALGIAANTAFGLREWANAGSTDIYVQNGFAARNGFTAAVLARHGITGPASALTGAAGFDVALSGGETDWDELARLFAGPSALARIQFKRFPACAGVQSVVELAVQLQKAHLFDASRVERIQVGTHHHGKYNPGCDNPGPWRDLGQAQMSNQLGVALACLGEPMTIESYLRYDDPRVVELAQRVMVAEVPDLTSRYPARSGAQMTVELKDGGTVSGSLEDESGLGRQEVDEAFQARARGALGDSANAVVAAARRLPTLASLTDLLGPLRDCTGAIG